MFGREWREVDPRDGRGRGRSKRRGGQRGGWERKDWLGERLRGWVKRQRSSWRGSRRSFCGHGGWLRRRTRVSRTLSGPRAPTRGGAGRGRGGGSWRGCWWKRGRPGCWPEPRWRRRLHRWFPRWFGSWRWGGREARWRTWWFKRERDNMRGFCNLWF